jgi:dienelactone hydrolase
MLVCAFFWLLCLIAVTVVNPAAVAATAQQAPATPAVAPDDPSLPGPYPAGWTTVEVERANGTRFSALLYYPALTPGQEAPLDPDGAPYPAVSFGHGYLAPPQWYVETLEHLASWGFLVIATESAGELFPSHPEYARDLQDCLTFLERAAVDPGSFLRGQVDIGRFGLSGHSMGGGAAILAAAADSRVQALIPMAPAETRPDSAIAAMSSVQAPVALLSGSDDWITPIDRHSQPMYDNGGTPKLLPVIQGGDHCGFVSELPSCGGSLSAEQQLRLAHRWLTAFFNLYLKRDTGYADDIWGPASRSDSQVKVQADAGFSVLPRVSVASDAPGGVATHRLTLTNREAEPVMFHLAVGRGRWPVELPAVVTVAAGVSVAVPVKVTVPDGSGSAQDMVRLSVTGADGLTVQTAALLSRRARSESTSPSRRATE